MKKSIVEMILEFIRQVRRNRRWQRAVTCVAALVVFVTTYALILPAITMEGHHPHLAAEALTGWAGDPLSVNVSAESPAGSGEKVVALTLTGEEAGLSEKYEFDENGVTSIIDAAGQEIRLHRTVREDAKDTVDYWFVLAAGQKTDFTLELEDEIVVDDVIAASGIIENVRASKADKEEAAAVASPSNAVAVVEEFEEATASNAAKASVSNALKASASDADLAAAVENDEVDVDEDSGEILDGAVIDDIGASDMFEDEKTEVTAELKVAAGSGDDLEEAIRDAEKNAEKRGDASIGFTWRTVVNTKDELTWAGNGVNVTMFYNADAEIPDGAYLSVVEIEEGSDEYQAYYDGAAAAVNEHTEAEVGVASAQFFDITILDADGNEIQPASQVVVKINYDNAVELAESADIKTVHFADEGTEVIDTVAGGSATALDEVAFNADHFSVFGVITYDMHIDPETGAQSFNASANGVAVEVKAEAGAFPEGTYMKVERADSFGLRDAIEEAAGSKVGEITAVDITFYSADGTEIQPAKPINVVLSSDKIKEAANPMIVHVEDDKTEAQVIENVDVDGRKAEFTAEKFSVYAIVETDDIPQPPRVTYEFEDPNNEDFTFIDKAGNPQTTQIIKNGEVIQDVGLPTIPTGETFNVWFIYNGENPVEALEFESPVTISYGEAGSGSSVSAGAVTIDPEELNEDGTYHVKVKAFFGEVVYLTFYEDAAGTNILNRIQIAKGSNYDISTQTLNAPESELSFGGWAATAGVNDDDREAITPTALTNIQEDRPFYPIFKSGHWISFYAGATGSGATYTAPAFVIAGSQATSAQPSNPTWKGYAFQYWTETNLYTGENGSYVQPSSAPARFNFNSSISENKTLYAYWTPADTTYTVVFWQQNISDSKTATDNQKTYSFAEQITEHGTTGTTVYAANYAGRYSGYTLNSGRSQTSVVVKADGTSIINIYFDRQLITMRFYRNGNSTTGPGYNWTGWTGTTYVTTFTGLYGQTLVQNGYTWPSGVWTYYATNNRTIQKSYLGQFVLDSDVRDTTKTEIRLYYSGNPGKTMYFFLQNVNGTYPTTYSDRGYGSSNTGTFTLTEKYDGFEVVSYQRGNNGNGTTGTWTAGSSGGTVNISNYTTLGVRYQRKHFTLKYLDSVDNTELSGISNQDVVYGASLSGYRPAASFTPVSQYAGKVWDGKWYKDQACSEEFDWSVTMPNADMVVYAGWEDVYYKVDIDPNGGTLTESESTFTWLTYGQSIQRYDDVKRDYAEDPNGNYKYESFLRSVYLDEGYDPWDYRGYLRTAGYVSNDTQTEVTMQPYSGEGSEVTISYPYDSTRYKYEKGAYALIGWYEITFEDGHYGELDHKTGEKLYTFGTGVTHDTYIQAKWRRVGDFHVEYKEDVYLMDADGNVTTSDSGIDTTNLPTDGYSYADQSESSIMRSPDSPISVTTGEGEEAETKQYVFQGWWYNGQLYTPGDVFKVLSSLAVDKVIGQDEETGEDIIQKTVYIYPVYQSVEDMPVDVTHIYWYSNWRDKDGNQIGSLTSDTQLKDETSKELQPNQAINIKAIDDLVGDSEEFEGYTFKGWARVPIDVDTTADTFNANTYMYLYWDGSKFHVDSEEGKAVTEVAADENTPYHDMYAVWEIRKYTVTVTKTVVGLDTDQNIGFTFEPVFTKYSGASNFILAGEETTVETDEGTFTYYTSKEFENVPYGATLTLTEEPGDDFDVTVEVTQTTDASGEPIANPQATEADNGDTFTIEGDLTIAFTNSRNRQKIQVYKTDQISGAALGEAEFTVDSNTITSSKEEDTLGYTEIISLAVSETPYELVETKAPDGYKKQTSNNQIIVSADGVKYRQGDVGQPVSAELNENDAYQVNITNSPGVELPNTGGRGTLPFRIAGLALMLMGAAYVSYDFETRRRRERRLKK